MRSIRVAAILAVVVAAFCLVHSHVRGQNAPGPPQPAPSLFLPTEPPGWVDPLEATNSSIIRSRPVLIANAALDAVDPETLDGEQVLPVEFNLFDDVSVTIGFERAEPRWPIEFAADPPGPIGYTWYGSGIGDVDTYAIMITEPGVCAANIHVAGVGWFHVRPLTDVHVVREIDGSAPWLCAIDSDAGGWPEGAGAQGDGGGGTAGATVCDDGSTIDVIVVYTAEARVDAGETKEFIEMDIDFAVAEANMAYRNSQISTQVRLLYKGEVNYSEPPGVSLADHLSTLVAPWDAKLDEVQPLRNALRADMVSLIVSRPGGGLARLMRAESPVFEDQAFSVVSHSLLVNSLLSFAHELGHNMGCHHDRFTELCQADCQCSPGIFDDSFGYNFPDPPPDSDFRTVMAKTWGTRVPHFSNPNVLYLGDPTGVPAGSPACDSADNARTINETRDTVAQFRIAADTTDTTTMASRDFFVGQGQDGGSFSPSISHSGQWIAFESDARNFAALDPNAATDVFLYNRESGVVDLMSSAATSQTGNAGSFEPDISGNGRFVGFASDASDFSSVGGEPDDTNNLRDIYVKEQGSAPMGVSVDSVGDFIANGDSFSPSLSLDGRFVAFASDATNLIAPAADTNGATDILVRDRDVSGNGIFDESGDVSMTRISYDFVGPLEADRTSLAPSISATGRFVAFESDATNLLGIGNDTNAARDIFVHDRDADGNGIFDEPGGVATVRVSVSYQGTEANGPSHAPSISADGRFVAFHSNATNIAFAFLYAGQGGLSDTDVFVHDRDADENGTFDEPGGIGTKWISHALGFEANGDSFFPSISANGRFVAFQSEASNLVASDGNGATDVFVQDLETDQIIRASINSLGEEGNAASISAAISDDGRFIALASNATNLVPIDLGAFTDVFFRDRGPMCPADLNGDGVVDTTDAAILSQNKGDCPCCAADLNGDGVVNSQDEDILNANLGPCP